MQFIKTRNPAVPKPSFLQAALLLMTLMAADGTELPSSGLLGFPHPKRGLKRRLKVDQDKKIKEKPSTVRERQLVKPSANFNGLSVLWLTLETSLCLNMEANLGTRYWWHRITLSYLHNIFWLRSVW